LQLDLLLSSLKLRCKDYENIDIKVLYRFSDDRFSKAYKLLDDEKIEFAGGRMFLHNCEIHNNESLVKIQNQVLLHKNGNKIIGIQFCDETCIYVEHIASKNYISEHYESDKKLKTVQNVIEYHFSKN